MIIGILARFVCNICCFLYPAYASYKALSTPSTDPVGDILVERWLMYWAVVGTWTAVETLAGWAFTWLPFYSLFKTIIFLYLSLPQTEGSTYIYRAHLAPLFYEHEEDIDQALDGLRSRATDSLTAGIGFIWEKVRQQLNVAGPIEPPHAQGHDHAAAPPVPPPSFQDPAGGAAQQIYGLFTHYAAQYLPAAMTAIQGATNAARSRTIPSREADELARTVSETLQMPVPVPSPSASSRRTSRTMQYASDGSIGDTSAWRFSRSSREGEQGQQLHPRSVSSGHPPVVQRNSDDSIRSRSSRSSLGGPLPAYGEMSSFESINRDEIPDQANIPDSLRPGKPRRQSSWFGWGGDAGESANREKQE